MSPFAHLTLGDIPSRPDAATSGALGSVPRGFFEIAQPAECHDGSPAFVRGMLMARKDYDALPIVAAPPALSKTGLHLTPRWALYGGPISTRKAARDEWQNAMQFWAQGQGFIWVPYGEACVVENHRIPWPQNSGFQWTWVREVYPPQRVVRDPTAIGVRYVWEGPAT